MQTTLFPPTDHHLEGVILRPLTGQGADALGAQMAHMIPWSALTPTPDRLIASLKNELPGVSRFELCVDGQLAGLICLQSPWLLGPYLQRLAILPRFQGLGLGRKVMSWMEQRTRTGGQRNLWLCVSTFNAGAKVFYAKLGFSEVAVLERLISESADEILMRKRLT